MVKKKATEQNHLLAAFPAITDRDPRKYQMQLLSSILGGGMSSRLFQQVREKNGLCYTVYSYGTSYEDVGLFSIYTALGRAQEPKAIACIRNVLTEFLQNGPTAEELDLVREQSKANVLMGLESTTARMSHLARCLLREGTFLTPDNIIDAYDAVTREQVLQLARETFDFDHVLRRRPRRRYGDLSKAAGRKIKQQEHEVLSFALLLFFTFFPRGRIQKEVC